jgi:hypothetical protein
MPRRLPSSALDSQTQLTASGTGAVLAANWYIGTSGLGAGAVGAGQVVGTLNGPLTGTADSAKVLTPGKALNGTTFTGSADITVPVNTTSIATSGTYYPTFVPTNTAGNQQASTHASLSYDPNTGYLSATRFVGSGAGLTGVVTSVSFNGAAAVNGAVSITSPAQVQPDWNATTGLGSILNKPALFSGSYTDLSNKPTLFSGSYTDLSNKPTLFDGNYNSLSNKPTIPSVSGTLKEVATWTSGYLGDGLLSYATGGGPIVTGVGPFDSGGPLGGWFITIYYEFDATYFPGYNAAQIAHIHVDYGYPVFWTGFEGGSVFSIGTTNSIVRRAGAAGPVCAVGVTIACNQSRNNGADYWPSTITVHFYTNQ